MAQPIDQPIRSIDRALRGYYTMSNQKSHVDLFLVHLSSILLVIFLKNTVFINLFRRLLIV